MDEIEVVDDAGDNRGGILGLRCAPLEWDSGRQHRPGYGIVEPCSQFANESGELRLVGVLEWLPVDIDPIIAVLGDNIDDVLDEGCSYCRVRGRLRKAPSCVGSSNREEDACVVVPGELHHLLDPGRKQLETAQIDGAIAVRVGGEMQNAVDAGPIDLAR